MFRGILAVSLLCLGASATADDLRSPEAIGRVGLPYDWTHRHVVFARPQTFGRLREIQSDPRYWHQVYRTLVAIHPAPPRQLPEPPTDADFKPDWGMSLGTTALNFTNLETYPAKYSFDVSNPTPSCTNDYVVFTLPASASTAINVIGFNNLYVNNAGTGLCAGTVPTVMFAYNASQNNGPLNSSPVLYPKDGTQIAFIEDASTGAQFHVLKWKSGNVSAMFGSPFNSSALANCATNGGVAPCEYSVTYSSTTATLSAPYVDYSSDTAYVTDDTGHVSAITPVFGGGTPAVKAGYPVAVAGSTNMTPPVYDTVSKNVFVADKKGNLYYVRTATASPGTCPSGSPPCLGATTLNVANGKQVYEAPILDSTNQTVFVFSNSAPTGLNSSVVQANTTLGNSRVATIGANTTQNVYAGTFNNAYFSNPGSGLLYACGGGAAGPTSNTPQLYAISFTGATMNAGAAAHGPLALATGMASCSPITEVFNLAGSGNTDLLYAGVGNLCSMTITGGCVQSFNITSGFPSAYTHIVAETGGTTGFVVDNVANGSSSTANQANIYFISQGTQFCTKNTGGTNQTGNCAIKLTQTGLQ